MNTTDIITGNEQGHLKKYNEFHFLEEETLKNFLGLKKKALDFNIDLEVLSSYRSFEKQLQIWNEKASGKRALLDSDSNPLNIKDLTNKEIVFSILRWSALPGASRHHFGTDFDVFDKRALDQNPGYKIELIPSEYETKGIFFDLSLFLNDHMDEFHFFRPYNDDFGGVAPEPWHLSYAPSSSQYIKHYTFEFFENFLSLQKPKDFSLLKTVLDNKKEIYDRFITTRPLES